MVRVAFAFPDGSKVVMFSTDQHPDFPSEIVNIQENLQSDIATYTVVADNISPALNKNILSVFNNLPLPPSPLARKIRIQDIFVYPRSLANHTVTLQVGYINSVPTGGTDIDIQKHAADYANPPALPDTVVAQTGNTLPNPIAGIIFGGSTFSVNVAGKHTLFEAKRNSSALVLRPNLDGITVRQVTGTGTTGTLTVHLVLTLD